ncbi:MAG: sensor histidine kinase [Acutalibacteraceae bacterium]|jgi:anti-sigma regulatory factor (Ser/Thr protein kinase)
MSMPRDRKRRRWLAGILLVWAVTVVGGIVGLMLMDVGDPAKRWIPLAALLILTGCVVLMSVLLRRTTRGAERRSREQDDRIERLEKMEREALSYEEIAAALAENYESVYLIDEQTGGYKCYYESEAYHTLAIARSGSDFFGAADRFIERVIHKDDRAYVRRMLARTTMHEELDKNGRYAFIYRLILDGTPVYHQARVAREGAAGVIVGVRNIDMQMRHEKEYVDALETMLAKERTHMEAILTSASGYVEVNLTRDELVERDIRDGGNQVIANGEQYDIGDQTAYTPFRKWWGQAMGIEDPTEFERVSSREYLIDCFQRGKRRASVTVTSRTAENTVRYCRLIFYLVRDKTSGDIMTLCVLYDVTEQRMAEESIRQLENALSLSRIKNFTSQMQPHFLYNALGSIQEIVLEDPAYASELIGDFTTHLRGSIRAMANDSPISFSQELANIRAYANIEKMRFGEKLRVEYDIAARDFEIMPLSIQPLVENAIQHGIYERGPLGGRVTVRSREEPDAWIVQVEDDGVGFDVEALKKEIEEGRRDSTGLKNLIFRLDKVIHARVDIQSTPGQGTVVTVSIPKEPKTERSDLG